jgi:starch phosphorylase
MRAKSAVFLNESARSAFGKIFRRRYVEGCGDFLKVSVIYAQTPKDFGKVTKLIRRLFLRRIRRAHSLPNYSGGLGILAGDHLKSASDLNVPLVAVGLFYRYGYFRQKIRHDGWQEERYSDVFESELALKPVEDENGERILVSVHIRGLEVFAQAWLAEIGRIKLYLLDTNVPHNAEVDRLITGHLYGGDAETRIVQEKVLGIGGVRLLRKLEIEPSVYHLNEGHSAFLTLELAREFLSKNAGASFDEAVEAVRSQCVFTTHTPVAAGNDEFSPEKIRHCFDANFISDLKISESEFFALGRTNPENETEWFGMTPLALRMCRSANGVSEKHGEVSRDLWLKMFPDAAQAGEVPITHITNGVHAPTWIAPVFQTLYEITSVKTGRRFPETRRRGREQSKEFPMRRSGIHMYY